MKFLKRITLPLLALMLCFSACQKDTEIDTTGVEIPEIETETIEINPLVARTGGPIGEGLDFDCFSITYPFDMVDADGANYTIDSDENFETLLAGEVIIVDFVYPLNIEDEEGNSSVLSDGEEMAEAFALCLPDGGWEEGDFPAYSIDSENSCFDLAYPLTLNDWEGNNLEVTNGDALNAAVAEGLYFFSYPLTLIDEDGSPVVVNDIDELFEALISCNGFEYVDSSYVWETGFEYLGCYMIDFPIELVLLDGTTVTVENHEDYCDLMLQGKIAGYAFPLSLTDVEGNVIVTNNDDELGALLNDCWDITFIGNGFFELSLLYQGTTEVNPNGMDPCYAIVYPISLDYDGSLEEISDNASVESILENTDPGAFEFELVFPLSVIQTDSTTYEINQIEDLFELFADCF